MSKCKECNQTIVGYPFHCTYCDGDFCINHYLPEFHHCTHLFPRDIYRGEQIKREQEIIDKVTMTLILHGG